MPVTVPINLMAVLACTVSSIILGSLWYGPFFGKPWMKLMGIDPANVAKANAKDKSAMYKSYAFMSVNSLIMSFVMAHSMVFAMSYLHISGINAGLQGGFWNWIGFIMPVVMGDQLWGSKSWKLFPINAGYYLVSLCMMGCILALWV